MMANAIFSLLGAQGDRHVARAQIGVWGIHTFALTTLTDVSTRG